MSKLRLRNHCTDCRKSVTESVCRVLELKLSICYTSWVENSATVPLKTPRNHDLATCKISIG